MSKQVCIGFLESVLGAVARRSKKARPNLASTSPSVLEGDGLIASISNVPPTQGSRSAEHSGVSRMSAAAGSHLAENRDGGVDARGACESRSRLAEGCRNLIWRGRLDAAELQCKGHPTCSIALRARLQKSKEIRDTPRRNHDVVARVRRRHRMAVEFSSKVGLPPARGHRMRHRIACEKRKNSGRQNGLVHSQCHGRRFSARA